MLTYEAYNNYIKFLERQSEVQKFSALQEGDSEQDPGKDDLMAQAQEDVERCVSLIMGKFKFFGEFIYKFRFLYTYRVKTMATDGHNFFINPKFCSTLEDKHIVFILCHEILHNVLMHFLRGDNYGINKNAYSKWNIATDYEINLMLVAEGIGVSGEEVKNKPMTGLYDEKYLDMPAEEIYNLLPDSAPNTEKMEFPAEVGFPVKIPNPKGQDKYGIIEKINADGTYEIKECTLEEARDVVSKVFGS